MLILSILTQLLIDALVFRWYLENYQPRADRSWGRVLPVAGLCTAMIVFPVAGILIDLFARTQGIFTAMSLGALVMGQLGVVKFALKTSYLGAVGVLLTGVAASAVVGIPGLLHPVLPFLTAAAVVAYRMREDHSFARIQALADAADG